MSFKVKSLLFGSIAICAMLMSSCSFAEKSEKEGTVSFIISEEVAAKINAGANSSARTVTYSGADESEVFMDIILQSVNEEFNETATVRVANGSKAEFKSVPINLEVFVKATAYKLEKKGEHSQLRTDLYTGESEKIIVQAGQENQVKLILQKVTSDEGSSGNEGSEDPGITPSVETTANYTVREWKQTITDEGYVMSKETVLNGKIGEQTSAAAAEYTGFVTPTEIEQQTIASDGSTIVNIYYDRITYTVTYNQKDHTSTSIPATKTYRYGAKVQTIFDTSDVSGYVIAGWFTDEACTTLYDSTVEISSSLTLYAKWVESVINGISVEFNLDLTDINVTRSVTGDVITFTAPESTDPELNYTYEWKLDGSYLSSTTNVAEVDTSAFVSGEPYDLVLYLYVENITTSEEKLYSAFFQIIKE